MRNFPGRMFFPEQPLGRPEAKSRSENRRSRDFSRPARNKKDAALQKSALPGIDGFLHAGNDPFHKVRQCSRDFAQFRILVLHHGLADFFNSS